MLASRLNILSYLQIIPTDVLLYSSNIHLVFTFEIFQCILYFEALISPIY